MDAYIGRLLDSRYEILEVIGTGGMAVVYKALDHRLNRMVAVKILKDELSRNQEFRRRFHAESQAVAMVSHPNIVGVFDVSRTEESDYIVMELIEGITLKQYLEKKGNLNWRETLHFSMQIAKALDHAHSRGIVHRDIKPHNIMILKDGSIKVADFGIARVGSAQNTLTREALGSVHYISPEQAKGARVDNRSDLYSLGVVMYEMLTGVTPYDGESPVAVAIQHINGTARCPSEIVTGIPLGLEQITMHAMNANPDTRYATAADMLRDMEEFRKTPAITFRFGAGAAGAAVVSTAAKPPMTEAERYASRAKGKTEGVSAEQRRAERARREAEMAEERKSKNLTVAIIAAAAVLIVLLIVILLLVLLGGSDDDATETTRGNGNGTSQSQADERIEVPNFVGMSYSEIDVADYTDFVLKFEGNNIPEEELGNAIVSHQDPVARQKVEKGETITLTLSPVNVMPAFEEMTEADLVEYLGKLGLGLKTTTKRQFSDSVEKDKIFLIERTKKGETGIDELEAGDELNKEDSITIYVSRGSNKMPDLAGLTKEEAQELVEAIDLKLELKWKEEFSADVEENTVIKTDPEKDTVLSDNDVVTVFVCVGDNSMPDLTGETAETAIATLSGMSVELSIIIEREKNDTVEEGKVIRTDPVAGTELSEKQTVTLYVSTGDGKVEVPDVLGMTLEEATTALEDAGFVVAVVEYYDDEVPEGCVISQSAAPNSRAEEGLIITIDISKGPQPTENTEPTEPTEPSEGTEP